MTLALYRYQLPFTQPLAFHGQLQVAREGLLVRIDDGWGEIAPLPGFSKETLADAQAEALDCLAQLARGQTPTPQLPSVQFGLDCARRSWPEQGAPLPEPYPLIQGSPQELLKNWKQWLHETPLKAKLKVARYPMRDELALIRLLLDRRPNLKLVLDANQGWTREEAWAFCGHLDPNRIEYLEDLCADFEDIAFVASRTGMPVALDYALRPVLQSLGAKHILPGIYATDSQVTLSPEGSYDVHSDVAVRLDDAVNLIITETLRPAPPVAGRFEPVAFSQVRCSV